MLDEDSVITSCDGMISILTLIVFNLTADSRLMEQFSLDQFIELMLQDSIVPAEGKIYQVYDVIYRVKFASNKKVLSQVDVITSVFDQLASKPSDVEAMQQVGQLLSDTAKMIDE